MKQRSLFKMFILIFLFEVIYLLFWVLDVQNDMKYRVKKSRIDGVLTVLLMIITLGVYSFIWQWNICKQIKSIGGTDKRVVTLIFSIFIIGIIINPFLIQSSINSMKTLML